MSATLLDFSRQRELILHARIIADVQSVSAAAAVSTMITGAFARDLHVYHAHGIETGRRTEDVDLGLAVRDWQSFAALRARLVDTGKFREVRGMQQKLRHASDIPVDLVPFSGVEDQGRHIKWPPSGETEMDVFGFNEALAAAQEVLLPEGVESKVASVPALALLKIVAWKDRHLQSPRKDAHDLMLIASNYLELGNGERLWNEFADWTQADDFDYQRAGALMLGYDIGGLLDGAGIIRISAILSEQSSETTPGLLPVEMSVRDPGRARLLLSEALRGLLQNKQKMSTRPAG